jgi:putative ABC transport system substrate-binding protein
MLKSSSIPPFQKASDTIVAALRADPLQPEIITFDLQGDIAAGSAALKTFHAAGVHLVVAIGSLATSVAVEDPTPLPVVFAMVLYPEASGFFAKPGSEVTGASLDIPPEVTLRHLKRLLPTARRIGVLYNPRETGRAVDAARSAAAAAGLEIVTAAVDDPAGALNGLKELIGKIDALMAVADTHVFGPQTTPALMLSALQNHLPVFGLSGAQVRGGALAALSADPAENGGQAAVLALRVLRGEKPRAIPMTHPARLGLVLNAQVARRLDIVLPTAVEAEAAEVIR